MSRNRKPSLVPDRARVCVGAFAGAHGVRGEAKLKSFTADPADVAAYGPVESEDGKAFFTLRVIRPLKGDLLLVRAPEIGSREAAETLAGTRLYVDRNRLDPTDDEDEFYYADLVNLEARDAGGTTIGIIRAVHNFGAGDVLEIGAMPARKGVHLVPFLRAAVPELAIAEGYVVIDHDYLPSANDSADNDEDDDGPKG
ncbi:MAG: ribosome maturation factor RimM [Pseudomonadota bacterium]